MRELGEINLPEFQYSFCSYSTNARGKSFQEGNSVSIQLLFLFNAIRDEQGRIIGGFNTASVLIQRSCCFRALRSAACFNTASVLIQHGAGHHLLVIS